MNNNISYQFLTVPFTRIDREDRLTDFSLSAAPEPLVTSIREIGVLNPVVLMDAGNRYRILCGHRRVSICASLGISAIRARVVDTKIDARAMLDLNLAENSAHRLFSDIEKSGILACLSDAGVSGDLIIQKYMPLLGLERSKKLYQDFAAAQSLNPGFRQLLHELNIPLRIFSFLFPWDADSRDAARELFSRLRPGANKWRDLLELTDETARIAGQSPERILRREEIQSILAQAGLPPHEQYDRIVQTLFPWRYPALAALKKKAGELMDRLGLGGQTKIRIQESFETEEIKIEIRCRDQKTLIDQADKLALASRSGAMQELMRLLKSLE